MLCNFTHSLKYVKSQHEGKTRKEIQVNFDYSKNQVTYLENEKPPRILSLSRKVYDDFKEKKDHSLNQKLINVRNTFEKYNLISALHTLFSKENKIYGNLLPPLSLLSEVDERNLLQSLKDLNFETKSQLAA